jgi:hypothetical protein
MKLNFPVLLDPGRAIGMQYKAPYHPYSIFIDPDGVITGIVAGEVTPAKMDEMLKKTLR